MPNLLTSLDDIECLSSSVRDLVTTLKLYANPQNWVPIVHDDEIIIEGDAKDFGEAARECLKRQGIRWDSA